jgi:hypothetical protein
MSAVSIWLVAAVLAQGVLVFIVTALLYRARIPLILRGKVRIGEIAIEKNNWPERSRLVENAYGNQFEMPVLFFVAALLALYFGATLLEAILAWVFVMSRYAHAFIHLTSNHVVRRFSAFALGAIVVAVLWLELIIRVIAIAAGGT